MIYTGNRYIIQVACCLWLKLLPKALYGHVFKYFCSNSFKLCVLNSELKTSKLTMKINKKAKKNKTISVSLYMKHIFVAEGFVNGFRQCFWNHSILSDQNLMFFKQFSVRIRMR